MYLPDGVKAIIDILGRHGHRADVVGGCVRDSLLGKEPYDYDVTTDATPDEMIDIFRDFRTVPTGIKHGTLTVLVDGTPYEITTYRRDGDYRDHRHPDSVTFTEKIADDLSRRDFTVNAMAYNPTDGLTDLFGGQADLKAHLIRAVGDPTRRFDEDALRILRAVRFSATLGFRIEEGTARAAHDGAHLLSFVSGERIYTEIKKLIAGPGAYRVLHDHRTVIEAALGITAYTLPDQMRFASSLADVRFFSLFAGYDDPTAVFLSVCERLRVDNAMRDAGMAVLGNLSRTIESRADVKLCLRDIGVDNTLALSATRGLLGYSGPCIHCHVMDIIDSGEPYTVRQLAIGGGDLITLGYRGAEVGEVLDFLITSVIKGDLDNCRDSLIEAAKMLHA